MVVFLLSMCLLILFCFWSLIFKILVTLCPGMDLYQVYPVWSSLNFLDVCFLSNFRSVNHYFFKYYSAPHPFTSLSGTPMIWVLDFCYCPTGTWGSVHVFFSLCFLCSDWVNSTVLSSNSLILSFVISIILLIPPAYFFPLSLYFSAL